MFCRNCGSKLKQNAKFCSKCGTPVSEIVDRFPNDSQGIFTILIGKNLRFLPIWLRSTVILTILMTIFFGVIGSFSEDFWAAFIGILMLAALLAVLATFIILWRKRGYILEKPQPLSRPYYGDPSVIAKLPNEALFYNEDWRRSKFFATSLPYYDILIDKDYFYLIRMPTYSSATTYMLVGLFVFHLIGAVIGYNWGSSKDAQSRKNYRSKWIDPNYKLISHDYESRIFLKIPVINLRDYLIFKKNKFVLNYNNTSITLKKNPIARGLLSQYLESNVLR